MKRAREWLTVARASRDAESSTKTRLPVLVAPMAGVSNFELVNAANAAGLHSSLACGFLSKESIRRQFSSIKAPGKTAANVFAVTQREHEEAWHASKEVFDLALRDLKPVADAMEVSLPDRLEDLPFPPSLDSQLDELLSIEPWMLSFTFNRLDKEVVREFQKKGVQVVGTATCLKEAQILLDVDKVDGVVAQGSEAGGHRGAFWPQPNGAKGDDVGTLALVRSVRREVGEDAKIYAAGGIVDAESLVASLVLGADVGVMGSAFLVTNECTGASSAHKRALSNAHARTVLTDAFSGRFARGLSNNFVGRGKVDYSSRLVYPFQQYLINHMSSFGTSRGAGAKDWTTMWGGQGDVSDSYGKSVAAFSASLEAGVARVLASDSWKPF